MDWDKIKSMIIIGLIIGLGEGIVAILPLGKLRDLFVRWFNRLPKTVQNVLSYILLLDSNCYSFMGVG